MALEPVERDAWAILAGIESLTPATFAILLERLGGGRIILELASRPGGALALVAAAGERPSPDGEPRPVLDIGIATAIVDAAAEAPRTLDRIAGLSLRVVTTMDDDYPVRLAAIDQPPLVLFVQGDLDALEATDAVAVVGTRRPTIAGRELAARIARALSTAGASVVSGLAVGIDGAAHAATVDAGGRTVAVIAGGHAAIYPRAHVRLARAIVDGGGALISELGPDTEPKRWSFPRRNRLISGLADATVVVEAPARSGALLTAASSLQQGRETFLVPGALESATSAGCLSFLREFAGSARIVAGVPQLLEDLGLAQPLARARRRAGATEATLLDLGSTAAAIADRLVDGHVTVDELVAVTDLPVATVLAGLTLLERRGLAVGVFGRYRPAGTLAGASPPRVRLPRSRDRCYSRSRS